MKRFLSITGVIISIIVIIFLLGPTPDTPSLKTNLPIVNSDLLALEQEIKESESNNPNIKPGNASEIIWNDPENKSKTPFSVVYLHGFSASPEEGNPAHKDFAKRYGCNLYIPRLFEHGLDSEEPMLNFTAEGYLKSASKAIAVAKQIGEKVIVMSCSTGSTVALYLASGNKDIHSLILYSPNIDLYNPMSDLLTIPWGLQIARLVSGGKYHIWEAKPEVKKYWMTTYRIEAIIQLKLLLQETMKESVFAKVKQPVFTGYYYRNEENQDKVVSVSRMKEMFNQLGTPEKNKKMVSFPLAEAHAIQTTYMSKDVDGVKRETYQFAENTLGMSPIGPL